MTPVAFLKLFKHHVQSRVVKHKMTRILVEFAQHSQRRVVIGVDESQIFDVQQGQNVLSVTFIHGNSRISCAIHNQITSY